MGFLKMFILINLYFFLAILQYFYFLMSINMFILFYFLFTNLFKYIKGKLIYLIL